MAAGDWTCCELPEASRVITPPWAERIRGDSPDQTLLLTIGRSESEVRSDGGLERGSPRLPSQHWIVRTDDSREFMRFAGVNVGRERAMLVAKPRAGRTVPPFPAWPPRPRPAELRRMTKAAILALSRLD